MSTSSRLMSAWTKPRLEPSAANTSELEPATIGFRVSIEGAESATS